MINNYLASQADSNWTKMKLHTDLYMLGLQTDQKVTYTN